MVIQAYLRDQCQGLAQVAQVPGPQIPFSAGFLHGSPNLLVSVNAPHCSNLNWQNPGSDDF